MKPLHCRHRQSQSRLERNDEASWEPHITLKTLIPKHPSDCCSSARTDQGEARLATHPSSSDNILYSLASNGGDADWHRVVTLAPTLVENIAGPHPLVVAGSLGGHPHVVARLVRDLQLQGLHRNSATHTALSNSSSLSKQVCNSLEEHFAAHILPYCHIPWHSWHKSCQMLPYQGGSSLQDISCCQTLTRVANACASCSDLGISNCWYVWSACWHHSYAQFVYFTINILL
jgi:hypothetical protein